MSALLTTEEAGFSPGANANNVYWCPVPVLFVFFSFRTILMRIDMQKLILVYRNDVEEESLSVLLAKEETGFSPGPMLTTSTSALTDTIGWFLLFCHRLFLEKILMRYE